MIRSLVDTLDRMLALIPADQELLRTGLCNIRGRAFVTPPAAMEHRWREAALELGMRLPRGTGRPVPAWVDQVIDLFEDCSEAA